MAELLIVDDEAAFRRSLRRALERAGHHVLEAGDVDQARTMLAAQAVELVLCDVNMPGSSGLELVRSVVADAPDTAIVMLTGVDDPAVADEALAIGAHGYLVKPVGANEARILVSSSLRRRELELARRDYVEELESKIVGRTAALRDAMAQLELSAATVRDAERDTVDRLVSALTIRSEETGGHIRRVGRFASLLTQRAGVQLWSDDEISLAAMLHDVGKIGIPDSILLKPGPLDPEERKIIERHSAVGNRMLADGRSPVLILGAQIALSHHERWDGTGYPRKLADDDIPLAGRIVAIADVFDALTSDRVYRPALLFGAAIEEMRAQSGTQFDPTLLELFFGARDQLEAIRAAHPDPA